MLPLLRFKARGEESRVEKNAFKQEMQLACMVDELERIVKLVARSSRVCL